MANLTQRLSDSIRFLTPPTVFGSPMKWGTDDWGNSIGGLNFPISTSTNSFANFADLSPVLLDAFPVNTSQLHSDSLSIITGPNPSEYLTDGLWNFVFAGGQINDENVVSQTYSLQSNPSSTWTLNTTSSTTWVNG